jgi:hypothetical protein
MSTIIEIVEIDVPVSTAYNSRVRCKVVLQVSMGSEVLLIMR